MLCMPDSNKCPDAPCSTTNECGSNEICQNSRCQKTCQIDTDCAAGFVCKNQACIEAQPANLGQPCNTNIPCVAGTICQSTSKGQICTVACGTGTGGFANGAPGSSCSSCAAGTSCIDNVGLSACLRSCSSNSTCAAAGGGLCGRINSGTPFCLCRGDADCASGYNCNKEVLGNLGLGACAQRGGGTCPTGYTCDGSFCTPSGGAVCGNGSCDGNEDCSSCPTDCPCPSGQQCQGGAASHLQRVATERVMRTKIARRVRRIVRVRQHRSATQGNAKKTSRSAATGSVTTTKHAMRVRRIAIVQRVWLAITACVSRWQIVEMGAAQKERRAILAHKIADVPKDRCVWIASAK